MKRRLLLRAVVVAIALAIVPALPTPTWSQTRPATTVVVQVGERKSLPFTTQVFIQYIHSTDRSIADYNFSHSPDTLIVIGGRPGRATITVRVEERLTRKVFLERFYVHVVPKPEAVKLQEELTLSVNEVFSFTLNKASLVEASVRSDQDHIVRAKLDRATGKLTLTGREVGRAKVEIRATMLLNEGRKAPFSLTYLVRVVPSNRAGDLYRRAKALLTELEREATGSTRRIRSLVVLRLTYPQIERIPAVQAEPQLMVGGLGGLRGERDFGAEVRKLRADLESNYSKLSEPRLTEASFLRVAYGHVREGIAVTWQGALTQAGYEINVLESVFNARHGFDCAEYGKAASRPENAGLTETEELKRLRARVIENRKKLLSDAVKGYEDAYDYVLSRRNALFTETVQWIDFARGQKLPGEALKMERFAYGEFEYDLDGRDKEKVHVRIYGRFNPSTNSTLDHFSNVSDSPDRISLGKGCLSEQLNDNVKSARSILIDENQFRTNMRMVFSSLPQRIR